MLTRLIQTSCTGVFQTLDKFSRTVQPGIKYYIPFVQKKYIVSNQLTQNGCDSNLGKTNYVFTNIDIPIQYKIKSEDMKTSIYKFQDYKKKWESIRKKPILPDILEVLFTENDDEKDQKNEIKKSSDEKNQKNEIKKSSDDKDQKNEIKKSSDEKDQKNEIKKSSDGDSFIVYYFLLTVASFFISAMLPHRKIKDKD
jgi:hypothetical protein